MSLSRRIRNIAKSQINALKDRLDKIDEEADFNDAARQAESDAAKELSDPTDIRPTRRSPEEIAAGLTKKERPANPTPSSQAQGAAAGPLTVHYRRLGLDDGSDLSAVEAAYAKLAERCAKDRFPEGSDEQNAADEIFKRVDASYNALRDALDPTAGRFDKLEL